MVGKEYDDENPDTYGCWPLHLLKLSISLLVGGISEDGGSQKPHILIVITRAMTIFRAEENLLVEDMELT